MAPRIKIYFENGALALANAPADGVFGMLCTGVAVASTFELAKPYVLRGLDSLVPLGVTALNNPALYRVVSQFYAEAGNGVELWIMAFPDTVAMSAMLDVTDATKGKALVNAANGRLRGLIVSRTPAPGYTGTTTAGLDADVALAIAAGQSLATWATDTKFAPLFVLLDGYGYTGNPVDLTDLTMGSADRVAVAIGATVAGEKRTMVALAGGRLAKIGVHRNIARVADGPVATVASFIGTTPTERADWESVSDKGYLVLRTYANRSGYFFTDDPTATLATSDYSHLTARRTIDKAYRIAYNVMLDKLMSEVAVNEDGTLQTGMAKSWQADVERAIAANMTANGELSANPANPSDTGVICFIDPAQNAISSSRVKVSLRVRPFAYARYIDIYLGFQITGK